MIVILAIKLDRHPRAGGDLQFTLQNDEVPAAACARGSGCGNDESVKRDGWI